MNEIPYITFVIEVDDGKINSSYMDSNSNFNKILKLPLSSMERNIAKKKKTMNK